MPAVMDDPTGPTLYRVSGPAPFPDPGSPGLPADILPRQVTLRDRQTVATIVPFASRHQLPPSLLVYLCDQLNREIDGGDTYPMMEPFGVDGFADYWFQTFGAVMLLGNLEGADDVAEGRDWSKECLGSFFIKPNYPGRSSHICNASFIVTDGSRNRGVGRLMGEAYLDWAPRLGYTYSVFNLVYETNVASIRIWDALGFKRIGRVKACGNLRSHPDRLIDAIIYGRDLGNAGGDADELVSEERFDKIRYYLKYAKYPNGADRAEKSRLRSAATHYKLLDGDKLMLKDKEVIADPARQYEIARDVHALHHGGINKTTATIAEKFHWSRIKETVSDVIRACGECKELGKAPNPGANRKSSSGATADGAGGLQPGSSSTTTTTERVLALQQTHGHNNHSLMGSLSQPSSTTPSPSPYANPSDISVLPSHTLQSSSSQSGADHLGHHHLDHHHVHHHHNPMLQDPPTSHHPSPVYQPIDPQIINHHHHHHHHHQHPDHGVHHHNAGPPPDDMPFDHYHQHADFQALLNATEDVVPGQEGENDAAAVDRDLEMLIKQDDDDDDGAMEGLEGDDDVLGGAEDGQDRHRAV